MIGHLFIALIMFFNAQFGTYTDQPTKLGVKKEKVEKSIIIVDITP